MASFNSLKSGFHSYTRTGINLSGSPVPSVWPNPGNHLTPVGTLGNMGPWRPSLPVASLSQVLTSWVILSVYFASFRSPTQLTNVSFSRLSSGCPSPYRVAIYPWDFKNCLCAGGPQICVTRPLLWAPVLCIQPLLTSGIQVAQA